MPKYTAKQSIGHFMPGDEIKGLEAKQLQALLASGAIEEAKAKEEPEADNTAARLAELEKANAELTAANEALTKANQTAAADKAKADQEVADLKAKVAELEKAKSAAKPKADPKSADETK
jgi:sialidase-1